MLSIALSIVAELSKRLLTDANPPNFIHSKDIKSNPATQEREHEQKRERERVTEKERGKQRRELGAAFDVCAVQTLARKTWNGKAQRHLSVFSSHFAKAECNFCVLAPYFSIEHCTFPPSSWSPSHIP